MKKTLILALVLVSCTSIENLALQETYSAKFIFVSPIGNDKNCGTSSKYPLKHIKRALQISHPGDTIILMPGTYRENVEISKGGEEGKPLKIIGMPGSVILGNEKPGGRVVYVKSSFVELINLEINGQFRNCSSPNCFHDKLIYVKGNPKKYVEGFKLINCRLKNALGECVRLKYVKNSEIVGNSIYRCGLRDFYFKMRPGKKNGEGIYVGTAPEQSGKYPDKTENVLIKSNYIATYGSECVDVKENSSKIKIIENYCTGNMQETVGGISVRSNNNLIANNVLFNNKGAGIRLGGDTQRDGIMNSVIGNFIDNSKCGIKVMRNPQGKICGNKVLNAKPFCKKKSERSFSKAYKNCN